MEDSAIDRPPGVVAFVIVVSRGCAWVEREGEKVRVIFFEGFSKAAEAI